MGQERTEKINTKFHITYLIILLSSPTLIFYAFMASCYMYHLFLLFLAIKSTKTVMHTTCHVSLCLVSFNLVPVMHVLSIMKFNDIVIIILLTKPTIIRILLSSYHHSLLYTASQICTLLFHMAIEVHLDQRK